MIDVADPKFLAGYLSGYSHGLERGRELADREAAVVHHRAWTVVQAAADLPTHAELQRLRKPRRPEWLDPDAEWPFIPKLRAVAS